MDKRCPENCIDDGIQKAKEMDRHDLNNPIFSTKLMITDEDIPCVLFKLKCINNMISLM